MKTQFQESAGLNNSDINITLIKNIEDFISLKEDWDRLANGLAPINSFEWMFTWWKYFKNNKELKILIAERNGQIVGIAPLFIENTKALKFIKFRKLCFLGGDISDYLDFLIVQDEDREKIFISLLDYALNNLSYDYLDFKRINTAYPNFDLWQKYSKEKQLDFELSKECPALKLADYDTYNEYYGKISKSLKRNLNTRHNKLQKDGFNTEIIFKNDINEEDIKSIGDINLNRQLYKVNKGELKRFCYFSDKNKLDFIKDYFCSESNNSKLLAYLKLNGTIVSYILALINDTTIFYWNTAVNPDYLTYGPSKFLINELIKYAFEKNLECFDFMRGTSSYKLEWSNSQTENYDLSVKMSSTAKFVYFYRDYCPKFIKKEYSFNKNLLSFNPATIMNELRKAFRSC
ncbi:MAG: GNAT family N-acetyltransferase [Candidatus Gastranaerophilales bacterium]|nr:GNAT family N-acetyltransferase [Candidatus Gastranaerophilales bacterium]